MATGAGRGTVPYKTLKFLSQLRIKVGGSRTADSGPWAPAFGPRCALAPFQRERAMSRSASSTTTPGNQLLAALSPADLNLLRPYLTPVALQLISGADIRLRERRIARRRRARCLCD